MMLSTLLLWLTRILIAMLIWYLIALMFDKGAPTDEVNRDL